MLNFDALSLVAIVLYATTALFTFLAAPKRDRARATQLEAVLVVLGTLLAYATDNLILFLVGWAISSLPLLRRPANVTDNWSLPRFIAGAGIAALAAAAFLMASAAGTTSIRGLIGARGIDDRLVFGLLIAGVLSRKCVVPLHGGVLTALERGSMLNTMLYMNGHLGIYLVARIVMPALPSTSTEALSPLADVALITAACAAIIALTETSPRRLLGLISVSQVSFLLAGLASGSDIGVNGALGCLVVSSIATTGLVLILRLLEVRLATPLTLDQFHGLSSRAPRLAALFLLGALALVGLPGTLGFVGEDLLFHGTLASHPELGLVLPLATALNAVSLFRLFSRLSFGKREIHVPAISDASPRERFTLIAMVAPLVVFGLFPSALLSIIGSVAEELALR